MTTIITKKLGNVGAEVLGLTVQDLQKDDTLPAACMEALEENGVLVFRELHIDDETQVQFSKRLDDVGKAEPAPLPSIYTVSLDPAKSHTAAYTKGTFNWHIDGAQDDVPAKATTLSAVVLSATGGETEFASTYAAYDDLSPDEKERFETVRVRIPSSPRSARSTRTRHPRSWPAGARSPTRSTHSCGNTALAGSHSSSASPRHTCWAWTSTKARPCWPTCWRGRRDRPHLPPRVVGGRLRRLGQHRGHAPGPALRPLVPARDAPYDHERRRADPIRGARR